MLDLRCTTSAETIKAVKAAPCVFVGVALTHDDVHYFRVSKAEAVSALREFGKDCPESEGRLRVRIDPADRSVWIA